MIPPATQARLGGADRVVSMMSMSLPDEIPDENPRSYLNRRTHRHIAKTLYSGGWTGPKAGSSSSILGDGHKFSHRPPNRTNI